MAATTSSPFELSKTSLCATSTVFARFLGARQRSKPMMCECAKLDLSSAKFPFLEPPPPVRTPYCGHEGGHRNRTANHHGNFYNILLISDDRHNEVLGNEAMRWFIAYDFLFHWLDCISPKFPYEHYPSLHSRVMDDDILHAVEKALPEIFPSLTTTDAKTLFWKSEENCYAIIFVTQSKVIHISYIFPDQSLQ
ncbi:hypothetical protein BHE74_00037637 [Ensete ventricosum]|nr:hypothetical protein BHE74_00037637 [Ensete ventricosum]